MPSTAYLLIAIGLMFAITFTLRALPFAILKPLRKSKLLAYLGLYMPVGILLILVIYTLRDLDFLSGSRGIPEGIALALTIALHCWKRNALLSIVSGTAIYVVLINLVFI
ncbi:branched-chain amino acid transporter permease [Lysinibacter cavernae]|uniref:Branched-subunit amino acid transport protein AzlD n=1 Tax=Lysinibacter cavernae TaxID=1640652 RepID=A0A7X5TRQ5_9MICO|nr:AzlD domain-containing protein [Lysinibacter cavernae]NIH52506.1 branched-subunit amino acid transport protein AzlD [Lysinibacter cavernae]